MSNISRFLNSIELDNDLDNLSSNGADKIRNICEDFIGQGGGGIPGGPFIPQNEKSAPFGVAQLDANGKILQSQFDNVSLNHLNDVVIDNNIQGNHVLKWSTQENQWVNDTFNLDDCDNVTIDNTLNFSQVLFYDDIGFNPPQWNNRTLTTSLINEPNIANPPNKYFTNERVRDYLNGLMANSSLLYNDNGTIGGLQKGAPGTYLRSGNIGLSYTQIPFFEILDRSSQVRTNFNIPANGSVNMLQWIMQDSGIFDNLIVPGNNLNPFFWGTRGDLDYGQWKIQNPTNTDIHINRVNIDVAANFIIFNFVNTLIHNIMDDNLNDGTVLVRPLGINHGQTGGNAQIINTTINNLGKFRTLTAGNNITITQNNDTITISGNAIPTSLNDLQDVIINNPQVTEVVKYNGTEWVNEKIYLSDIVDVAIASPANGDTLVYENDKFVNKRLTSNDIDNLAQNLNQLGDTDIVAPTTNQFLRQTAQGKWANQNVSSQDIPESGTSLYYNNTRVENYLKTILTSDFDLLTRNNGLLVKISKGTANQLLTMNALGDEIIWADPAQQVNSLNDLADVAINNIQHNQSLIYNIFTNNYENKALTTDLVAEGLDVNRKYYTDQKVTNVIIGLLQNQQILYNNNGNLEGVLTGPSGFYLGVNQVGNIGYKQIQLNELSDINFVNKQNKDLLVYNSTTTKYENKPFSTFNTDIDSEINNYLQTILTQNEDILIRRNGLITRLPISNDVTQYLGINLNTAQLEWKNIPAGVQNLNELQDCMIDNPILNDGIYFLKYNGNNINFWVNEKLFLSDVSDVTITSPNNGDTLFYNNTGFENRQIEITDVNNLQADLNDKVNLSSYVAAGDILYATANSIVTRLPISTNGKVLKINNNLPSWENETGGAISLNDLTDVTITNAVQKDVLYKSNGDWVNSQLQISDITNLQSSLDNKLNNNFNAYGQIIIGAGGSAYQTFPKGNDNTFLQVQNGALEYSAVTIPKVTNLQTELNSKINSNILTTEGDLLIRGATANERLPIGASGKYLGVVNGNVEWANLTQNIENLSNVNITNIQNNQVIKYNSTTTDWENVTLDTSMIPENTNMYFTFERSDTNLKNKFNQKGMLLVGSQNLDFTQFAPSNDNSHVLHINTATGSGLEWKQVNSSNVIEGTNLFYTDTRFDNRLNSKYTQKGRVQIGTGASTFAEQAQPTATFQVLTSDINNVLNNTGLSWSQLALNNNYFSNLNLGTLANNQVLYYNNTSSKWENKVIDTSMLLPIVTPNNTNYWGAANVPFQTQAPTIAGQCTGMGTRAGGGGLLSFFVGGTEYFTVSPSFIGMSSAAPQFTLAAGGSATTPRLVWGTTGSGIYSSGTNAERWNWGRAGVQYGYIDNISLNTQTRLDIKNTKLQDFAMDINNIFNTYAFRNSAGTTSYFIVDTANNRCRLPNQFFSTVLKLDNAANLDTNITLNNNWFNLVLGTGASLSISNNALSTPYNINYVANTDEITINNLVGRTLRFDLSFSFLIDKDVGVIDISCFDMSSGGIEIVQSHKRFRCDANYYYNYSCNFNFSPVVAAQRISIKVKASQGATVVVTLTNLNLDIYDLML